MSRYKAQSTAKGFFSILQTVRKKDSFYSFLKKIARKLKTDDPNLVKLS